MSKHTPGPWREAGGDAILAGHDHDLVVIGSIKNRADVLLTAAAPDLLDALEEAANWDGYDEAGEPAVWLERAVAAIAKAKGEVI